MSRRALVRAAAATLVSATACRSQPRGRTGTPQRVVSRTVFADEVLWAMGPELRARVVGLSPMVDDPRYSLVVDQWPDSTPRLGLNPEQLLALAPDLVIVASFSAPEYRAAIEPNLAVLVLEDFSGFAGYLDNVARIGEALAEPDAAQILIDRFTARTRELEAARPAERERPTVLAWDYGYVPGSATSFDDAARCAGFVNLPARERIVGHHRLDAEQLVAWDPEWIVVSCSDSCADAATQLAAQPGFSRLTAVTRKQVIAIEPPYLATVGEGMLELSARMQAALLARTGAARG